MTTSPIKDFWNAFLLNEKAIGRRDAPDPTAMNDVLRALTSVDTRLYYHVGHRDSGRDLIISAEGNSEMDKIIENLLQEAPSRNGWRFIGVLESEHLFGKRNKKLFPQDENGDILFAAINRGDNLLKPRFVDFSLVFPSQTEAHLFIEQADIKMCRVSDNAYHGAPGFSWEVNVACLMQPSHSNISNFEKNLADVAANFGGRNDGWGFMEQR